MKLREFLDIHKSTKSIHVEKYIDEETSVRIGLFQNIDILPESYLNSEVAKWGYKLDIIDMKRISTIPVATIKLEGE